MKLRKIPLEPFIQILTDLFDSGADFIDISGEPGEEENGKPKDTIHITVKPEYLIATETIEIVEDEDGNQHIEMDYSNDEYMERKDPRSLSDEDINDLI